MFVYVLDMNGQPLMPTSRFGKVYRLLKNSKAKVVKKCPFTIKLLYEPQTRIIQECNLGVDTGSSKVGVSVYSNGKILYQSQIELRNDIKDKMDTKRKYRRSRRFRNTRYRKPRFDNRGSSIKTDRFPPTMISKFQSHIREIEYIKSILPISKLILETGIFDTHLMKNPEMNKHWGYQKGLNYGFENTKAKVLNRDNYTCQHCKGKHKDSKLEVHHIIFKSQNGSDEEDNLITLCSHCHKELHKGNIKLNLKGKLKGQLKYATQMNSIRYQLLKYYSEAIETFGFITKTNRFNLGLEKDHYIDACVIASSGNSIITNNEIFYKKVVGQENRQLSQGIRDEQVIPKGKIQGFNRYDKVKYLGNTYFIKGRMNSGFAILQDIEGNKVDFSNQPKGFKTPKLSNCKIEQRRNSVLCIRKTHIIEVSTVNTI